MGTVAFTVAFMLGLCLRLQAMDRWVALSQIESGGNDFAKGAAGEVSRYQIKPSLWLHYASPRADWKDAQTALSVARNIMEQRCAEFERRVRRAPSDFEFYILWNAPARINRPTKDVRERALRFRNLISRQTASLG